MKWQIPAEQYEGIKFGLYESVDLKLQPQKYVADWTAQNIKSTWDFKSYY